MKDSYAKKLRLFKGLASPNPDATLALCKETLEGSSRLYRSMATPRPVRWLHLFSELKWLKSML
jgi:hypothetical protein